MPASSSNREYFMPSWVSYNHSKYRTPSASFTLKCRYHFNNSLFKTSILCHKLIGSLSYFWTLMAILVLMFNDLSRGIFLQGELLIYICYGFLSHGSLASLLLLCNSKQYTIYQLGSREYQILFLQQILDFNKGTR